MPVGKRRTLKAFFKPGEWQHSPRIDPALPIGGAENVETALSVLNPGVPLTVDAKSEDHDGRGVDEAAAEDVVDKLASPLVRTPLSPISDSANDIFNSGDRERTQKRYQAAVLRLKQALDRRPASWDFLHDVTENDDTSTLRKAIEKRLSRNATNTSTIWSKGRKLFEQIFVVFFPVTKNILMVAKEAQSV